MSRLILLVSLVFSTSIFADTYDMDFDSQVSELTAKAESLGNDLQVESVGVEDLEAMRLRIEG